MPTDRAAESARVSTAGHPRLAAHSRLTFDSVRGRHVLLGPESVSVLNRTGAAILGLCDGTHSVAQIIEELHGQFERVPGDEVARFVAGLVRDRYVEMDDG